MIYLLKFLKSNFFCEGGAQEGKCKGIPDAQQREKYDSSDHSTTARGQCKHKLCVYGTVNSLFEWFISCKARNCKFSF